MSTHSLSLRISGILTTLFFCLTGPLAAQTSYDAFSGTSLDAQLWFPIGSTSHYSVSKGALQLQVPSPDKELLISSTDGLFGDFEVILDFDKFASTATSGYSGVGIRVLNGMGQIGAHTDIEIGISGTKTANTISGQARTAGFATITGTSKFSGSKGQLRIQRAFKALGIYYRATTTSGWTTIFITRDHMTPLVLFEIFAKSAKAGAVSIAIDKISYTGTKLQGSRNYGKGCLGLRANAWGPALRGRSSFGVFVYAGQPFALFPIVYIFGFAGIPNGVPLGAAAPGCSLYANPNMVLTSGSTDQDGFGGLYFPLPNDAKLKGASFYSQFAVAGAKNAFGFALSNGVKSRIE